MLAILKVQYQIHHVVNVIMTGTHDMFPPDKYDKEDAISLKNVLKKNLHGQLLIMCWNLNLTKYPVEHTIWIIEDLSTDILNKFEKWIREVEHGKEGIPFEDFQTYLAKLRYAFITIPAGKGLLSPCNQMSVKEPNNIFLQGNKHLFSAIHFRLSVIIAIH